MQLFGGFTVAEEGWKVSFFPLFVSHFFFLLSVFECVSPEDGAASEQHISVNIRYLFPMPPVNTDKRQHCVVLWLHIPKDYAHSDTPFFSSLAFCVCSNTLFFFFNVRSALNTQVCVAYLALRSSEHGDVSF